MYISYVRHVWTLCAWSIIGNTCARFYSLVRFYSSFATCSEHVHSEYFHKELWNHIMHRKTCKENRLVHAHTRTRQKQPNKGRKEAERARAVLYPDCRCINSYKHPIVHRAYIHYKRASTNMHKIVQKNNDTMQIEKNGALIQNKKQKDCNYAIYTVVL